MRQSPRLTRRALAQSGFHQGMQLELNDRVVRVMMARAALRMETVKKVRSSEVEGKAEGGREIWERNV